MTQVTQVTQDTQAMDALVAPVAEAHQVRVRTLALRWVERGVCPRAGHEVTGAECRREIRGSYRKAVKAGEHVPIPGAYQGQGVPVNVQEIPAAPAPAELAPAAA
jgi:hypothetical protein